jgi:hypothetical protein
MAHTIFYSCFTAIHTARETDEEGIDQVRPAVVDGVGGISLRKEMTFWSLNFLQINPDFRTNLMYVSVGCYSLAT